MKQRSRLRASVTATLIALAFCATSCNAEADGDETALINLVALASQRLALAVPVAQWKWANARPITDAPREAALLAEVDKRARAANVDPAFARAFFQDQIDASKQVQEELFDTWRKSRPPEGPAPDLAASTRPQLDRLTQALIPALARVQPMRNAQDCPSRVARSVDNWKAMTRYGATDGKALATALAHVCTAGGVGGAA
jgi:chorismate mutase